MKKLLIAGAALLTAACSVEANQGTAPTTTHEPHSSTKVLPSAHTTSTPTGGKPSSTAKASNNLTTVTYVVDGDTIEVSGGARIRFIGIDTPERGQCGYAEAKQHMKRLVLNKRVRLIPGARTNTDRYGRLLRYVEYRGKDTGLNQIKSGYAIARYDSRDGYGHHPREEEYIAADKASPDYCNNLTPTAPVYENCTAAREAGVAPLYNGDPGYSTKLDRDGDGVACES